MCVLKRYATVRNKVYVGRRGILNYLTLLFEPCNDKYKSQLGYLTNVSLLNCSLLAKYF